MQQLTITLPDHAIASLNAYCRAAATTPAEIVSSMIAKLPPETTSPKAMDMEAILKETRKRRQTKREAQRQEILDAAFGAWADDPLWKGRDSVAYVRQLRAEWDRPEDPD